jgi:hypothetical protein
MHTTIRRLARFVGAAALLGAMLLALAGPVAADPSTPDTLTFHFTDCTGPAGTPGVFDAVKQPGNAAALHIVDGRGTFVAVEATDVETGTVLFSVPGFAHNGLPTVACRLVHPVSGDLEAVVGLLAPVR